MEQEKTTKDGVTAGLANRILALSTEQSCKLKIRISPNGALEIDIEGATSDILETAIQCVELAIHQ